MHELTYTIGKTEDALLDFHRAHVNGRRLNELLPDYFRKPDYTKNGHPGFDSIEWSIGVAMTRLWAGLCWAHAKMDQCKYDADVKKMLFESSTEQLKERVELLWKDSPLRDEPKKT